ncbi:hypothetical protein Q7P37_011384 [Cladosporium fusiforme]
MQYLNALGTACSSFFITNIDDLFILVTFFAEAASGKSTLTPFTITLGQYVGFTVILVVSMIGFAATIVLPTEPIGFLGFLPMLLGFWSLLDLLIQDDDDDDEVEVGIGGWKAISKVATITVINGGDNIGTYIPLFSQAKSADMAVYLVTYYVLLGVLCFFAWLVMQQKDILDIAEKYAQVLVPVLYMGLGLFILIGSECYPWLIDQVDAYTSFSGATTAGIATTVFLVASVGVMLWFKLRKRGAHAGPIQSYTEVAGDEDDSAELHEAPRKPRAREDAEP